MKKAAIIISSITFGLIELLSIIYSLIFLAAGHSGSYYENEAKALTRAGIIFLVFAIIYLIIGLLLLIYVGNNVCSYNQVLFGVIFILFISIPGGILLICLPRAANNPYPNSSKNTSHTPSGFRQIMDNRENGTNSHYNVDNSILLSKCKECGCPLKSTNKYLIIRGGGRVTVCNNCLSKIKESGESVSIISSPKK